MSKTNGDVARLQVTKNYRLFHRSADNRPLDLPAHKPLMNSMKEYGFLKSFPISVFRDDARRLVVKDGQHRLALAEELNLPVYYIIDGAEWDVAKVNSTPRTWAPKHYALTFAAKGKKAYGELLEFHEGHGIPITTCVALLTGATCFSNYKKDFLGGKFVVKDREWAEKVASLYTSLIRSSKDVKSARLLEACMGCCRVDDFNGGRLIDNVSKCREKLLRYSTRDAFLAMLDDIYNFGRHKRMPLKFMAQEAMAARNPAKKKATENGKT